LSISASIGIASDDGSVEQPKELLDNAALAVREAKRQGGNTFCWKPWCSFYRRHRTGDYAGVN